MGESVRLTRGSFLPAVTNHLRRGHEEHIAQTNDQRVSQMQTHHRSNKHHTRTLHTLQVKSPHSSRNSALFHSELQAEHHKTPLQYVYTQVEKHTPSPHRNPMFERRSPHDTSRCIRPLQSTARSSMNSTNHRTQSHQELPSRFHFTRRKTDIKWLDR